MSRIFVWSCTALLALLGTCQSALAQSHPAVEAFGRLPVMESPMLSPDGKHYAAVQSLEGRPVAVIYPIGFADKPAVITASEGIIDGVRWVKNDRLVVYLKLNRRVGDPSELIHQWTRAVSFDVHGGDPVILMKNNLFTDINTNVAIIDDVDLDDPDNIYMPIFVYSDVDDAFRYDLYRVNVRTGSEERVAVGKARTAGWYLDGHGKIIGRLDHTEKPLLDHVEAYDKGDWREIGEYDATEDRGAGIVGIDSDGTALIRSALDASKRAVFTRLDLAKGKETPVFANPTYDADIPIEDPWTGRVVGAGYVADRPEVYYFDPKMEALQRGLEQAFPNVSASAVSWDTALKTVIVEVEAPKQPPTYYYLDRESHQATKIASAYPGLSQADLGDMKPYPYKARDGLDIPAYLTLPPGKASKNLPAIVLPHGGPDSRDDMSFDWMAQFFANRGYAVLQPNYRGSAGYGHKFTEAGLHQWGLKMQDDITDGVKKMIADGIVDPKRVCIVGASYGGYAALAGATLTPDLYACAISFAGISDLPVMIRSERSRYGSDSGNVSFWLSRIGSPDDDSEQLRATSPDRHADQVKCPILLLHGETDITVPIKQSELMNDALNKAGKQVEFVRFPGEDHYFNFADTRVRFLKESEAFLTKTIGN